MALRSSQAQLLENGGARNSRRPLGRALSYGLVFLLVAGCLAAAAVSYLSLKRELTQAAMVRNAAVAQLAAATLAERLERMTDFAVSLATRVRFAELVADGRWTDAAEILRAIPGSFDQVERLFLADARGTLRADIPELPGVRGENFAHRAWFQGVTRDWQPYVSPVYRRAALPRVNVIAVAAPVRGRAPGTVAGVLVLQLSLEAFFDWSRAIGLANGAALVVMDPAGRAAFASGVPLQAPAADLSEDPLVARLRSGGRGTELVREGAHGAEWLQVYEPSRHGWGVILRQPAPEAFATRDAQLALVQLAFALLVLLAATLAWVLRRAALGRREQLARARHALARHDERLRILGEIDRAMAAERPAEEIAAAVIRPLRELLDVPRAIVNRIDLEAGTAEWVAAAGRRRTHVGPGVRYPLALMGELGGLRRGEPQLVDTSTLPQSAETQALLASGVRYYKVVPMIAGGELLGAISFGGESREFPAEQVAIAQEVATQLAIATTQARLLERVRRHADELEARVRARTAELEAANRELDAFSYSVSHDLRAPLRAVDGYSRMLEEDFGAVLDAEGRRLLGVVRGETRNMGRLIDDLLDFSRLGRQPLAREALDMAALVRSVVEELGAGSRAAVAVGELPPAHADPRLLRQVWVNLIDNALKYSAKRPAPEVSIDGMIEGSERVYRVRDNGAGFDMRYADKLFGVFQRLHHAEDFSGTGVGLAIVHRVVGRHGGRVWAEGRPDEGACFYFSLPGES
jgi:signal transduction histidine kinase